MKERDSLQRALFISVCIHLGFLLFFFVSDLFFPSQLEPITPSLRVDIIGLPDHLKTETPSLQNTKKAEEEKQTEQSEVTQKKQDASEEKPKVVVKDKKEDSKIKKKPEPQKTEQKAMDAVARLKALEKIKQLRKEESVSDKNTALIKGNLPSAGTSLSDDAKESSESSYYDLLRDRIRIYWELPKLYENQNLSAKVRIFITSSGSLRSFRVTQSSGNPEFDQYVIQAVKNGSPYPPPPSGVSKDLLLRGIIMGFPL